jgi:hypothetical protein
MVDSSAAIRRGHPISFLLFTFVAFIVAVIASTLVADYNSNGNAPTKGIENATRFLLFAGWWGFLIGAVYVSVLERAEILPASAFAAVRRCAHSTSHDFDTNQRSPSDAPPTKQTGLFLASVGGVITSIAGHGVALFLTWIFWLAGAAALTDRTGGSFNCADKGYPFPYCNSTKALMAFAWIGWIILTLMFAVVVFFGARAFSGGRSVKESLA